MPPLVKRSQQRDQLARLFFVSVDRLTMFVSLVDVGRLEIGPHHPAQIPAGSLMLGILSFPIPKPKAASLCWQCLQTLNDNRWEFDVNPLVRLPPIRYDSVYVEVLRLQMHNVHWSQR